MCSHNNHTTPQCYLLGDDFKNREIYTADRQCFQIKQDQTHYKSPLSWPATPQNQQLLAQRKLSELKPLYTDFQRKVFQDFLKPIEIPNLKTFNAKEEYDSAQASRNWLQRSSTNPQDILATFHKDKAEFDKLIKYLLEVTPPQLKISTTKTNWLCVES